MKKLITILTIMIVLAGSVFATVTPSAEQQKGDGTAYIDITATIDELAPRFELRTKSANIEAGKYDAVSAADGSTDNVHASAALQEAAITSLLSSSDAGTTVTFSINQTSNARLKGGYTFSVTATDLELVAYTDGAALPQTLGAQHKFTFKSAGMALGAAGDEIVDSSSNTAATIAVTTASSAAKATPVVLTVNYDGVVNIPQQASNIEVGVYSLTWNNNQNAVSGDYQATVTMEVTCI